jgi:hypothetical protein
MANTRFKTENGLLVTGGNAEFVDVGTVYIGNTTSRANLFIEGDLIHVNGNLVVTGTQQIVSGQSYTGDILAGTDGLKIGNTTSQFNAYLDNGYIYQGLYPVGNTIPLGDTTNRWVGYANSLDISTTLSVTGPVTLSNTLSVSNNLTVSGTLGVTRATTLSNTLLVTGAVTLSNTLTVANAVTLSNTLSVANAVTLSNTLGVTGAVTLSNNLSVSGILTATSNVNLDSGVLFVDGVNNRVGINNTAPGVALRVTGAVDISSTANIQGNANVAGTLGVNSAVTLANTLAVTGTTTLSNNLNVSSGNVMITSACTHHVSGNVNFSSSSLYVDAINSRVGIGTSSPDTTFKVSGSANITGATVLSNTLNVVGAVNLSNALSVSGNTTLSNAFITAISANGSFGGSGQFLTSNSTGIYWSALSGGSIGGTNTQVQFNDSGSFGATAGFTFNKTTNTVAIGNTITVGTTSTVNGSLANLQALNVVNQTNTGTLFVTTSANVGTAFTTNSTLTNTVALNVVNQTNTATLFVTTSANVGSFGTTNGTTITTTSILTGNSVANATHAHNLLQVANSTGTANLTATTLAIGSMTVNSALANLQALNVVNQTNTGTLYATTSANVGAFAQINSVGVTHTGYVNAASIIGGSTNSNFDSGVLFVDAVNNRVGINNTAPGVALRVTGAVDISSAANVAGTLGVNSAATLANTLAVTGATTIANTLTLNDTGVLSVPAGTQVSLRSGKNHESSAQFYNILAQAKIVNTAMIAGRTMVGLKAELVNESIHTDGVALFNPSIYGTYSYAYNGNTTALTDARTNVLYGMYGEAANYANGSVANTVGLAAGGTFVYESSGSGVTTNAHGAYNVVQAANNTITGNITTAYGVRSQIKSNTAMTIGTGYLFHGQHLGSTTTNKYGVYVDGESNNYFSGNVHIAGTVNSTSYRIGTDTLVVNSTIIALGPLATTNGVSITTTSIDVGNSTANASLDHNIIFVTNSSSRANLTPTTLAIGSITVNSALANLQALNVVNQTNTGTLFVTTSANIGTAFTANSTLANAIALNVVNQTNTGTLFVTTSANVGSFAQVNSVGITHTGYVNAASIVGGTTNSSFDSGVLFVDAINNRVGINNTAPGVELRVTGAADISSTANIQGNANVGGTLGVNGAVTFANTLAIGETVYTLAIGTQVTERNGRTITGTGGQYGTITQLKMTNVSAIANRYYIGNYVQNGNESQHLSADGLTQYNPLFYGVWAEAWNGNTAQLTNSRTNVLAGAYFEAANYANGSVANTVGTGYGAIAYYISSGSGVTTTAYGGRYVVTTTNNSITGNIGTAYGISSIVNPGLGMTIDTAYLYHGDYSGTPTNATTRYGLFLTDESNNYLSGNVHVAGTVNAASYRLGTSTLVVNSVGITHTGFANVTGSVNSAILSVGTSAIINSIGITHTGFANVTGSANVGGTLRVAGAANALSTLGITGAANALGTLGVNGLLTAASNLNVTNQTNTGTLFISTSANVGTIGTSNGVFVNSTLIMIGNSTSNTIISSNGVIVSNGKFTGNGAGLTSTTYVSSYSLATDTDIFVGGDSSAWKLGATYTPTIEEGVSTIDIQVYAELYIKQVSDNVPTSGDIYANASAGNVASFDVGGGGGNPLLRYRVTKTYSGGNTTLYTSDYITLSAAGTIAAQLNTIRDTTPTVGSGSTYRMEYEWVPVSSIAIANAGTASVTINDQNMIGTGTEFQAWINPRNTITLANTLGGYGTGSKTYNITAIRGPTSILLTEDANTGSETASSRFFRINDPYANVNLTQTFLGLAMTGYK